MLAKFKLCPIKRYQISQGSKNIKYISVLYKTILEKAGRKQVFVGVKQKIGRSCQVAAEEVMCFGSVSASSEWAGVLGLAVLGAQAFSRQGVGGHLD